MTSDDYEVTRRSLHGVAELVLAGPCYAGGGSIRLRVDDRGIYPRDEPGVLLTGGALVADGPEVSLDGLTYAEAAERIGRVARRLDDVYHDGPGLAPSDVIRVNLDHARLLERALSLGDRALRVFAPEESPVLWPEHFDVAITVDEVNYGVSPGDGYSATPYMYVGPHERRTGPFWNAPFGATLPVEPDTDVDAVVAFFRQGRSET